MTFHAMLPGGPEEPELIAEQTVERVHDNGEDHAPLPRRVVLEETVRVQRYPSDGMYRVEVEHYDGTRYLELTPEQWAGFVAQITEGSAS